MELIKVVARYIDGRVLKGYTRDFFPNKPEFHLEAISEANQGKIAEIRVNDLKAIFFVKNFSGNPSYDERKHYLNEQRVSGRKVRVTFLDGEVLTGSTVGYEPNRQGFFMFPPDPETNNLKIYAVMSAIRKVEFLR